MESSDPELFTNAKLAHKPSREDLNSDNVYKPNIAEYKKKTNKSRGPKEHTDNSFVNQDRLSSHET